VNVQPTAIPGVLLIEPKVFGDHRGYFFETWSKARYEEAGVRLPFVQDNVSYSTHGILRGLHVQNPSPQGKLVGVLKGEVFDVVVDIRRGSPAFGRWYGATLSADNRRQLYLPPGVAHGFAVTGEDALFQYKCTDFYSPATELTLAWDDPDVAIAWPMKAPTLSAKDKVGLRLKDLPQDRLVPFA
jgi:dTDP-4-dehydrorhamnose 3,5-epimerase